MEIDNFDSWLHTWPHVQDRKLARRTWEQRDNAAPDNVQFHELETAYYKLLRQYEAVLASTSWRMTAPLRMVAEFLRKWRR
jgi:hypothetical protein